MNRLLLPFTLLLSAAAAAQAADSFAVRVYPTPRAAALTLDGKLDDPDWQQAPLVSGFTGYEDNKLGEVQTAFRVLYDDKYLYFGIHCDEPNMDRVQPTRVAHDEHGIFRTEVIELFLDPGHTHDLYYQLAFNVAGSLYDGERESTSWNSDAIVKTHMGPDFWSVELAMPWSKLGGDVTPGRVVGFNLNRSRHVGATGSQYMTWTQVQGGFHDPARFAHLVLSGTPEMIGKLGPEFRKGDRTGPIHVYSAEGFSQQSYSQLAQAALAELDGLVAGLQAEQKRETDKAAAAELVRRLAEHQQQLADYHRQAQKLNAAEWSRLDVDMQKLRTVLSQVLWDARLSAILGSF